jgi:pimeloyl-ACP methyl ester carboxylesterase
LIKVKDRGYGESLNAALTLSMIRALSIVYLACILSSCNLARMHDRASTNRLLRQDYRERTFTDDAGPHHVWSRDTGKEKILLIHGYTGTGAKQWSRTAKLLRSERDAILPDLLCHGSSTANWGFEAGGNIDAQVAHILLLLDSLHVISPIDVVGSSYGGGVAARLAELHPDRVKVLVINDGLVSDYTAAIADSVAQNVGAPNMLAVMGDSGPKGLRYGVELALYKDPPIPGFILKQIHRENVAPYRAAQVTLIEDLMANEAYFATKTYDWKMPVYLIWGDRDELIPNTTGRAILTRNGLPVDHWTTIPRTGHVPNLERPKAFVDVLRDCLKAR